MVIQSLHSQEKARKLKCFEPSSKAKKRAKQPRRRVQVP